MSAHLLPNYQRRSHILWFGGDRQWRRCITVSK